MAPIATDPLPLQAKQLPFGIVYDINSIDVNNIKPNTGQTQSGIPVIFHVDVY